MILFQFDRYLTMLAAILAVTLGTVLKKRISFLNRFCIPAPVVGGLLFALLTCLLYVTHTAEITFDDSLREVFMVLFFTSIGFQANIRVLKEGGKPLLLFLVLIIILILLQNTISVGLSVLIGESPLLGLCTGSIPMVGGHGTAGAFGPVLEDFGIRSAMTVCTAASTFGLIAGSLMGGPLANRLIRKYNLHSEEGSFAVTETKEETAAGVMEAYPVGVFLLIGAAGAGTIISHLLSKTGMVFPVYIGAMLAAALFRNVAELLGKDWIPMPVIENFGGICLTLFLGMAMITLQLWQLARLALPLLFLLSGQVLLMLGYTRFIVFPLMGRDYDAAVMVSGTCGFGMGATPNAMANMSAITEKYGPSVKAFLLIPIVGSLFADFINSLVITFFINLL